MPKIKKVSRNKSLTLQELRRELKEVATKNDFQKVERRIDKKMEQRLKGYATQQGLEKLGDRISGRIEKKLEGYATQRDLELWGGQLQHQIQELRTEMKNIEHRLIENIPKQVARIMDERMEALLEHKAADLLGVTGDEVKLIQKKQADHEERITKVEKTIGVR